jgi:hypothetical protein
MRRILIISVVCSCTLVLAAVLQLCSVFANRAVKDLASSQNGSSGIAGDCSDNFPTPFAAVLNGQVTPTDSNNDPPTCTNFPATYPNYSLPLTASDQSFTVTVTPVLWGNGNASDTILHLEFSSTNANLNLQSFVINGLATTISAVNPAYIVCDFAQGSAPTNLYVLEAVANAQNGTLVACTQPTMEAPGAPSGTLGFASSIQPTPIQFADVATTRWDIVGLSGSATPPSVLPSVDLLVSGVPSDLSEELGLASGSPTNNLTSAFMSNQGNFLAVALDSSTGKIISAGGLSIQTVTEPLTNDSISSSTMVDPTKAITPAGFTDQVQISTATPEENADGTQLNPPTNPPDPVVPGACFGPGAPDTSIFRTVWYSFTPIGDGTITISTTNSRFDTVAAVYTGSPGGLTPLGGACDDNFTDKTGVVRLQAVVQNISVMHGASYFIMVGESPTQIGDLNDSTTGNPVVPPVTVASPLSNDATLFLAVNETATAPAIVLAPTSGSTLSFGNQQVGAPSASQSITVTSNGGTPLTVSNINVPSGFAYTTTCNVSVPQGSSCQINVNWTPTTTGPVSGNVTFSDNVTGSSPTYAVSGNGINFTVTGPTVTTATLSSTSNATYDLSVTGSSGFAGSVSFSCSGLPTNTQCMFNPNPATPGTTSVPVTLTVSRISTAAMIASEPQYLQGSATLVGVILLMLRRRKKTRAANKLVLIMVTACALLLVSCSGGGPSTNTPPPPAPSTGTYPFSLIATSSGYSAAPIALTLSVQ